MALFYVGYLFAVSSTIAFILAILTPEWIYPNTAVVGAIGLSKSYRGIFSVDYGFQNGTCRDWILTYKDSIASCRPRKSSKNSGNIFHYSFFSTETILAYAVACAALSIVASSLSIILLWLAGGYLYVRRRRLAPNFVLVLAALTLLICK